MNDQHSELVFESLLEEMLTGQHPPNLLHRIENAWQLESKESRTAESGLVIAELVGDCVDQSAELDSSLRSNTPVLAGSMAVQQVLPAEQSVQNRTVEANERPQYGISARRTLVASLLAVTAACLLLYLGWHTATLKSGPIVVENQSPQSRPKDVPENLLAGNSPEFSTRSGTPQDLPKGLNGEVLDLRNLPFGAESNQPKTSELVNESSRVETLQRMSSQEIVQNLDQRLSAVWEQLGVQPNRKLSDLELAAKIHQSLVGRTLPDEVAAKLSSGAPPLDPLKWSTTVTGLTDFPKHWASLVTGQWMKRSSLPLDGEEIQSLKQNLSQRIAKSSPWNEVPRQLLGGEVDEVDPETLNSAVAPKRTDPPTPSTVFFSALAGGGNHRLLKRIGSNFLNDNVLCAKCHDGSSSDLQRLTSQQDSYWSMISLLNGVDAQGNGFQGNRFVTDRQARLFSASESPTVFYDLLDGRIQAAEAKLPDGTDWSRAGTDVTPRQAFGDWIAKSAYFDRAVVNQTWKLLFGKHLVPQVEGINLVANQQRVELLDFLAGQFRSHDYDLRSLVTWISSSDAFARASVSLTRSQWVAATEEDLARVQLAELVFATGPLLGRSAEAKSLESSLATAIQWSPTNGDFGVPDVTLAQPDLSAAKAIQRSPKELINTPMPVLSFAIHGEHHTAAERAFVKRLLNSMRLSWEQRVEHIVAIGQHDWANSRIQQLAKQLLQKNAGDAEQALLDLLWAVSNSDAG